MEEESYMYQDNSRISLRRTLVLLLTTLIFVGGELFLVFKNDLMIDALLCMITLSAVFVLVLFMAIVVKRVHGELHYRGTNYTKLLFASALSVGMIILFSYRMDIFLPFMLIAFFFAAALEESLAMGISVYLTMVYSITCGINLYYFYGYVLCIILGILFTGLLRRNDWRPGGSMFICIFCVNLILSVLFYYFTYLSVTTEQLIVSVVNGVLCGAFAVFIFPRILHSMAKEEYESYERLLDDEYSLMQDIKRYSFAEFEHARRVSRLAGICAEEIGADTRVARCAGLYYRLGKIEGEPEIDNAVQVATNHCFPPEVISILTEYGGIVRKPQTPESAIVHMADILVSKIELLGKTTMSSSWNQDMVIYQTLNEYSQAGMYDESGLSMNRFLKVRERLVKEDSLL
ncbi:MAG: hypothetical protein K6A69_01755 [Lachnospiraceae bacterium]|nr:hypothetical protein [Lachnospiraceae bacterium]